VLQEVGASGLAQIEVYNKADLLGEMPRVEYGENGSIRRVWLSAQTGDGTELLVEAIGQFLGPELVHRHIILQPEEGRARAKFFAAGAVLAERAVNGGAIDLEVSMPRQAFESICRSERLAIEPTDKTCAHPDAFLESGLPTSLVG
jgi:GTPase